MRRTIMIGTLIAVLVGAGAAYAALNNYTAQFTFKPAVAGTAKKPAPVGFVENLGAANATSSDRAAPLVDIKSTIYGLISNSKQFPTCSYKTIDTGPKYDAACPKASLIGTGPVNALLGGTDLSKGGTPCNTFLHVYNAGGGKAWYFFTTKSTADCGGLTTGETAPYEGTSKQSGKNLVLDVPLPPDVSTAVANHQGLYGSLIKEVLTFPKETIKAHGKTYGYFASVACKSGKRPFKVAFTAVSGSSKETRTVTGSGKC